MVAPVYPKTRAERATVYVEIILEIKSRLAFIQSTLSSKIDARLIKEISYLQLRNVCELIALACLVAQGDFDSYRKFDEEYSPAKIFKHLSKLWKNFFLQSLVRTKVGTSHNFSFNSKPNALTQKELQEIWAKSGNYLHTLSVARFFKPKIDDAVELEKISKIIDKFFDLINDHGIAIQNPKSMLIVALTPTVVLQFMDILPNNQIHVEEFKVNFET